ncbi:MAG: peptide chain release factor-like protein [Chlamydiia bacterium]|nr:peptide chain release factor-like protein [Chlamydiia bacterium]
MSVSKDKQDQLKERMERLGIKEEDLVERFILGSGKGGQKVNKTNSCVHLQHPPSGIDIKCQRDRSRELNRFLARRELCDRIEERSSQEKSKRQQEAEKVRRQKRRRTRRSQQKMLEDKKIHGEKKALRQPPQDEG